MAPSVSVVIPFFREGALLGDCVESVLSQSFSDLDIVLVDNNATEGTRELANRFAARYPKTIRVIHEAEQGTCSARNRGIREAGGEYIALMDGDDMMKPDRIKMQYETIRGEEGISLVSCHHDSISHDGKTILQRDRAELSQGSKNIHELKGLLRSLLLPLKLPHHPTFDLFSASFLFFKRQAAIDAGLFDTRLNPRDKEDWEFSLRLFETGKFVNVPQSLQFYREESAASRQFKIKALYKRKTYLHEQKFFSILWERYGKYPENGKVFRRLQAFSLKRFGQSLMQFSQGKDLGRALFRRALIADPSDLRSWKLYIKSLSPSTLHPRFFDFRDTKTDELDVDLILAEEFLQIPPSVSPDPR